jgi:drug/metabolite transporter (DMT)-like permease
MFEERAMNPTLMLIIGTIIYMAYAWLTFAPSMKMSPYLMPFGIGMAVAGNFLWIMMARSIQQPMVLVYYGMLWDTMITLSFILVPVVFFGIRFTLISGLGCLLVLIGLTFMKLGTH